MTPPPSMISRRPRNGLRASVTDATNETELARSSTPNANPLGGPHRAAQMATSSFSRYRRSPPPSITNRAGVEGASTPAPTPAATSITAQNANILRTVSNNANSLNHSITQNNLQFTETLQMFNHSSSNTFDRTTFTSPARDSYSFNGPVALNVNLDFVDRAIAWLQELNSTPSVPISGRQVLQPWADADALERGQGLDASATGIHSRLRRLFNGNVSRAQDSRIGEFGVSSPRTVYTELISDSFFLIYLLVDNVMPRCQ
ncbi:hypothetical protein VKT23_008251 [Stygiomarasmius scandens]|uniref:Uncharacterized protein n=1 Tax=Marasmiellus scandens TaxID=2682957 RepID=A0ABR1JIV1_9AGAR